MQESYRVMKRLLDVMVSLGLLIALSPLILVISLACLVSSGWPILFVQTRVGLHRRAFKIYKFRTMIVGAERMGDGVRVTRLDSRITPVGRILRSLSLDELPQLVNILFGDMSLVGPRPVLVDHPKPLAEYSENESLRFTVRPGLTGLAQVRGRGAMSWDDKLELDAFYARNASPALDAWIILQTVSVVLSTKNVYRDSGE